MRLSNIKSVVRENFEAWMSVNRLSVNISPCFERSEIDGSYITPGMEERFEAFIGGWAWCDAKAKNPICK